MKKKFYKIFIRRNKWDEDKGRWVLCWSGPYCNCPSHWTIRANSTLTLCDCEVLDLNCYNECCPGIHYANNAWIRHQIMSPNMTPLYFISRDKHANLNQCVVYEVKPTGHHIDPLNNRQNKYKKFRTDKLKLVRRLSRKEVYKVFNLPRREK